MKTAIKTVRKQRIHSKKNCTTALFHTFHTQQYFIRVPHSKQLETDRDNQRYGTIL